MKTSKLLSNIKILIIALALSVGMSYAFADWTTPKSVAPTCVTDPANSSYDGGCLSPINIGSQSQAKLGPLTISAGDFRVANGKIGVGTLNPFFSVDASGAGDIWGSRSIGGSSQDNSKWFYMLIPTDGSRMSADIVRSSNTNLRIATQVTRGSSPFTEQVTVTKEGRVGIGTSNPAQTLDVNGTVAIRGGAPGPGKVLTSVDATGNARWVDAVAGGICDTAPFQIVSINTVYQNTSSTQLIVVASAYATSVKADLEGYIGPSNTPTTLVATDSSPSMVDSRRSITFVVPPGYFYKISDTNSSAGYIAQAWKVCGGGSGGGCRSESGEITSTGPGKYPVTFNRSFYDIPMIKTYIYATSIPAPYLVPNMEVPGWTDFETTSENVNNTYWGIVLDMVTNASFKIVQQPSWVDGMRIKWIAIGDC